MAAQLAPMRRRIGIVRNLMAVATHAVLAIFVGAGLFDGAAHRRHKGLCPYNKGRCP